MQHYAGSLAPLELEQRHMYIILEEKNNSRITEIRSNEDLIFSDLQINDHR